MPIRKRVAKMQSKPEAAGAASDASATTKSGIKKRVLPSSSLLYREGSELAELIARVKSEGSYGDSFYIANSKKFTAPRLPTGILGIDLPLGGGWAMGRAGMLYGERSGGKSTVSLLSVAAMQRNYPDKVAVYVDLEGTFDEVWATKLGVDTSRVVIVEPEGGEHACDLADAVIRTKEVGMVITDSIAMLVPMKEVEESVSKEFMGLQARLIGKFVRRVNQAMLIERKREHYVSLIHINQFRMKVGLVFGDPRTLPGGKALEYSTSQQIEVKNKEIMGKDARGDEVVMYNDHALKISKNKAGGPLRESLFKLIRTPHDEMPEGWVDQANAVFVHGTKVGLITGSKQSYQIENIPYSFRGDKGFNRWAVENQDAYRKVCYEIVERYRKLWNLT